MGRGKDAPHTLHPTPDSLQITPCTLHPTTYTLSTTPYTPHPAPHTLHPAPHTLHPTPYTLHTPHPTPYTPETSEAGAFSFDSGCQVLLSQPRRIHLRHCLLLLPLKCRPPFQYQPCKRSLSASSSRLFSFMHPTFDLFGLPKGEARRKDPAPFSMQQCRQPFQYQPGDMWLKMVAAGTCKAADFPSFLPTSTSRQPAWKDPIDQS